MLAVTAALAAAGALAERVASAFAASAQLPIENEEDLARALPALSNWGRFGPDDEIGTLNFMSQRIRTHDLCLRRASRG
jgi:hypothetical protein